MTQAQPSQTNNTYGDGLSVAFELVATPAVFGLFGFGLDRWLGTTPVFVIGLTLLALATVVGLTIWRYGMEMDRVDAERRQVRATNGVRRARWERDPERLSGLDAESTSAELVDTEVALRSQEVAR